ncbi:MAG: hypothetical protein MPJ50_12655 [Pirellulales bacterium]|nr:hypothetical protein [Pirellulales bacterium]
MRVRIRMGVVIAAMAFAMLSSAAQAQHSPATGQQLIQLQRAVRQTPPPPPPVRVQGVRRSNKWITLPSGSRVAVDQSITGQGVRVYLGLLWHLVAVDEDDDTKVLWGKSTSAFWDKYTIEEIEAEGQDEKSWAVVLRSSRHEQFAEYHDLRTGKFIKLVGEEENPGTAVQLRQTWSGSGGNKDEPLYQIVSTKEEWARVYQELFAGANTAADGIKNVDFSQEALLVYYGGKTTNCRGFGVAGAFESDEKFVVRVSARTYQSDANPPPEHPFGIYVLPRMTDKPYVIQRDRQGLIGGPDIWKEDRRFEPLKE